MDSEQLKPVPSETNKDSERLLGQEKTGVQARLLFGDNIPSSSEQINRVTLQQKRAEEKEKRTKKLTTGSLHERSKHWEEQAEIHKQENNGEELTKEKQIEAWQDTTNAFLDSYRKSGTDEERRFFKSVGMDLEQTNAEQIYRTFIKDHNGDMEYFAELIAANNSEDQIEQNSEIIKKLATMYGGNSAKITELLTHGIKNIETDTKARAFIKSAHENLAKGDQQGKDIVDTLDQQSQKWEDGHPARTTTPDTSGQTQPTPESSRRTKESGSNTSVRMAGKSVEGGKGANQDSMWFDEETGAALVADGIGGEQGGVDASRIVKDSMAEAFQQMPTFSSAEEAKTWLREQILKANEALQSAKGTNKLDAKAGTTLATAFVWEAPNGERTLITGNVGDSRISGVRNNELTDLTLDHAYYMYHFIPSEKYPGRFEVDDHGNPAIDWNRPRSAEEIQKLQEKFSNVADSDEMDDFSNNYEESILWTLRNNMFSSMKGERINILTTDARRVETGDTIFIRSDGLTDVMTNEQTMEAIRDHPDDPEGAVDALLKKAHEGDSGKRNKGKPDDKSVVVMKIKEKLAAEEPSKETASPPNTDYPNDEELKGLAERHPDWPKINLKFYLSQHGTAEDFARLKDQLRDADIYLYESMGSNKATEGLQTYADKDADSLPADYLEQKIEEGKNGKTFKGTVTEGILRALYGSKKIVGHIDLREGDPISPSDFPSQDYVEPSFGKTLDNLRKMMQSEAQLHDQREKIMTRRFETELEEIFTTHPELKDKPELNIVASMGDAHTTLIHKLRANGVNTERTFSNDPYTYDHYTEAIRDFEFGKEPSQDLIAKAHLRDIVNSLLGASMADKATNGHEKEVYIRQVTSQFNMQEIESVHDLVTSKTLTPEAFDDILRAKGIESMPHTNEELKSRLARQQEAEDARKAEIIARNQQRATTPS